MSAPTVSISEASYQLLNQLAERTGQTTVDLLDKALDAYRRKLFFEQMNAGYAELRADPEAWAEHLAAKTMAGLAWDTHPDVGIDGSRIRAGKGAFAERPRQRKQGTKSPSKPQSSAGRR
jgi:hypothetical protein